MDSATQRRNLPNLPENFLSEPEQYLLRVRAAAHARLRRSPTLIPDASAVPDGSSITANAPTPNARRHGWQRDRILNTRPSRRTNTMSIENFMNQVWTLLHGARIIALLGSSA
jgi:hypothetical protein